MGFISIKSQLVATLQTVASLKVVYGKEEKVFSGYPAACVSGNGYQGQFQTVGGSGANKETYQHFVRLYFRTDEANDPDYEDVLESVADDVIAALRHNVKLNNTCDYSLPLSGRWLDGQKESPVRVFEIIESATVYVTR
jgi:hypothetical protein